MKLQDVILKAMAKKLTWIEAAEIAGMSVRNMQRKRQVYQEYGYNGLFDRRRGKKSYHRVPMETAERVLALYQEKSATGTCGTFTRSCVRKDGRPAVPAQRSGGDLAGIPRFSMRQPRLWRVLLLGSRCGSDRQDAFRLRCHTRYLNDYIGIPCRQACRDDDVELVKPRSG